MLASACDDGQVRIWDQGNFVIAYGQVLDVNAKFDVDINAPVTIPVEPLGDEFCINTVRRGPQVRQQSSRLTRCNSFPTSVCAPLRKRQRRPVGTERRRLTTFRKIGR